MLWTSADDVCCRSDVDVLSVLGTCCMSVSMSGETHYGSGELWTVSDSHWCLSDGFEFMIVDEAYESACTYEGTLTVRSNSGLGSEVVVVLSVVVESSEW